MERQRWEYRNRDETWSILLMRDTVILQTTAYTRFEDFAERLRMAVHTVLAESEHDRLGVVHRVGLRYIDVVRPSGGKDFRFYLRPGLHGVPDEVFQPGRHLLHTESRGRTRGRPGTPARWSWRIVQNDQGSLPPDLVDAAMNFTPRAEAGELVTLIDMDHFIEGNFDADAGWGGGPGLRNARSHHRDIPRSRGHRRRDQGVEMTTALTRAQRAQTTTRSTPSAGRRYRRARHPWVVWGCLGRVLPRDAGRVEPTPCVPGLSKNHVQFPNRPP